MRILLVDDHALFRAGFESLLIAWGETVVGSAPDGQQGLEKTRLERPDFVFMDVNLPDMSGFEAALLIKAEMPGVRVVMLTAQDEPGHAARSAGAGADGYLLKDMSEDALRRALAPVGPGEFPEGRNEQKLP